MKTSIISAHEYIEYVMEVKPVQLDESFICDYLYGKDIINQVDHPELYKYYHNMEIITYDEYLDLLDEGYTDIDYIDLDFLNAYLVSNDEAKKIFNKIWDEDRSMIYLEEFDAYVFIPITDWSEYDAFMRVQLNNSEIDKINKNRYCNQLEQEAEND